MWDGGPGAAGPLPPFPPRLARSTLTLVPLLGVHEVVFAPVTEEQARGALRLAKLGFEIFFSSFQVLRLGARQDSCSHSAAQPLMGCDDGILFIHSIQNTELVLS